MILTPSPLARLLLLPALALTFSAMPAKAGMTSTVLKKVGTKTSGSKSSSSGSHRSGGKKSKGKSKGKHSGSGGGGGSSSNGGSSGLVIEGTSNYLVAGGYYSGAGSVTLLGGNLSGASNQAIWNNPLTANVSTLTSASSGLTISPWTTLLIPAGSLVTNGGVPVTQSGVVTVSPDQNVLVGSSRLAPGTYNIVVTPGVGTTITPASAPTVSNGAVLTGGGVITAGSGGSAFAGPGSLISTGSGQLTSNGGTITLSGNPTAILTTSGTVGTTGVVSQTVVSSDPDSVPIDPADTLDSSAVLSLTTLDLASSVSLDRASSGLVMERAQSDPAAGLAWASNLSDPSLRSAAQSQVAAAWVRKDPAAALAWASSLPESSLERPLIFSRLTSDPALLEAYRERWAGSLPVVSGLSTVPEPGTAASLLLALAPLAARRRRVRG